MVMRFTGSEIWADPIGCACHSSGLSVQSFLKGVNFISYDEKAFRDIASNVITLANSEDLPAHGEAMKARFE